MKSLQIYKLTFINATTNDLHVIYGGETSLKTSQGEVIAWK